MKTYTEKEVVKLLADFGTHVAEQCTGKKLEIAGELMKWWKLNIPAVVGRSEQYCDNADRHNRHILNDGFTYCSNCGKEIQQYCLQLTYNRTFLLYVINN